MDKIFLIGHRGVGKTTLVKDMANKSKANICFDLDQEIENRAKVKIFDLITQGRVAEFRSLEHKILKEITGEFDKLKKSNSAKLFVALGAGFLLDQYKFPKSSMVLWLRRISDAQGRIFFDRPRLTQQTDSLKEWDEIFQKREKIYEINSTAQVYLPEYFDSNFNALYEYLNFVAPKEGFVTLLPKENDQVLQLRKSNLELRTDLLSAKQILDILKKSKGENHIVALRNLNLQFIKKLVQLKKTKKFLIDWEMSLGFPSKDTLKSIDVFSSHEDQPIPEVLIFKDYIQEMGLKNKKFHYKICPQVESHEEAIQWDLELSQLFSKNEYSFLPRSNQNLSLSYFRQLKSYQQKIGFYRFGEGTSSDQPLWWSWPKNQPRGYYGILGENISHSRTPAFHFNFFKKKSMYPLSIESFSSAFEFANYFSKNGLKALAVTSPYKNLAYKNSNFLYTVKSNLDFKSSNTVVLNSKLISDSLKDIKADQIFSFNTDYVGLKSFFNTHLSKDLKCVVWGGGALLEQIKDLLPEAEYYSAQLGQIRTDVPTVNGSKNVNLSKKSSENTKKVKPSKDSLKPVQLIWASGEKGLTPEVLNDKFSITKIIDLDYRENSKARLFCSLNSIEYVNGMEFFIDQAMAQQNIWDTYEF